MESPPETLNPKWDQKFELLVSDTKELEVFVFDHDMISTDDLCGQATLHLENSLDNYNHDIWLNLVPQGKIHLRVKFEASENQDISFHFSYMFRFLKRQTADMIRLFTDQMTPFFSDSLGKMVVEANSKSFFGSSDAKELTQQEAEMALAPLKRHLETNLGMLSDKLYQEVSKVLVKKIWKAIIRVFKLILIPSIEEDITVSRNWFSKKVSLTTRQVSLITKALDILKEFFSDGGDGLDDAVCSRCFLGGLLGCKPISLSLWFLY